MKSLLRGFSNGIKNLPSVLKALLRLFPLLLLLIRALLRWKCRRKKRNCENEIDVPADTYKRADPMLYAQYYLMKMGLAVTWDNPDIVLYRNGVQASYPLLPDTAYDVKVRVWNNSYDAPAVQLPVFLSFLSFGASTTSTSVGMTKINLGVKGSSQCPAFASFTWKTPAAAGHYCLQAYLQWTDDANPDNNLGQENTNVGQLQSPATFTFRVKNNAAMPRRFTYEVDDYTLPKLRPCADQTLPPRDRKAAPPSRLEVSRRRWAAALATQAYGKFSNPPDWNIQIVPDKEILAPLEEITVHVSIEPAFEGFTGRKAFNIQTFSEAVAAVLATGKSFEGGVTLYVEK